MDVNGLSDWAKISQMRKKAELNHDTVGCRTLRCRGIWVTWCIEAGMQLQQILREAL